MERDIEKTIDTRHLIAVGAAAFLLHFAGVFGGYTLDDPLVIHRHPAVNGDAGVWEVFVREFWGRPLPAREYWSNAYRPVTTLTLALEHRITQAAWFHHLVNVILFALLAVQVTRVATRWCGARIAFGMGLFFAVLSVHVESVASIVGRADILAALFCLVAFELVDGRSNSPLRIAPAAGLYLLGLLSKESVALFPGIVLWFALVRFRRDAGATWRCFIPGAVIGAVGLAYLTVRQLILPVDLPPDFVGANNLLHEVHGVERAWGNLTLFGRYAELTFVPWRLCADHTYADSIPSRWLFDGSAVWSWLGLLLLLPTLLSGVAALRGRGSGVSFAFLLSYLLIGQWIIDVIGVLAERVALWPSVWLMFALGALFKRLGEGSSPSRLRTALVVVLLTAFSIKTVTYTLSWRDDVTLFSASARSCPKALRNRLNLAHALSADGQHKEAVWHFALSGVMRSFYPDPIGELPAFDMEHLPVDERLLRLPELAASPDPVGFWIGLHGYLTSERLNQEARVVEEVLRSAGQAAARLDDTRKIPHREALGPQPGIDSAVRKEPLHRVPPAETGGDQ